LRHCSKDATLENPSFWKRATFLATIAELEILAQQIFNVNQDCVVAPTLEAKNVFPNLALVIQLMPFSLWMLNAGTEKPLGTVSAISLSFALLLLDCLPHQMAP
jgi:hypothetical protein